MRTFTHMARFQKTLLSGGEWSTNAPLWLLVQASQGISYLRSPQANSELPPGELVVIPPNSAVTVLASQLGEAVLKGFSIKINSLSGLLTAAERLGLEKQAAQECAPFQRLAATHPLTLRLAELFQRETALDLSARLGLLQSFAQWLEPVLHKASAPPAASAEANPRERLREFLNQVPESELVELSLSDVARQLCCCDRHASRLFHEVCGCSFRKYVSNLRLQKACQMLLHSDYKIIDVALESGHSSLALFNYTFKSRFRMTPSEWRQRHLPQPNRPIRPPAAAALELTS